MAGNKRPRKAYRPKPVGIKWMPRANIDYVKGLYRDVAIMAVASLPYGVLTFKEANMLREFINDGSAVYVMDEQILDPEWSLAAEPVLLAGQDAFHSWYQRGLKRGGRVNESTRFVATGPELQAIRDAVSLMSDLLQSRMEDAPVHVVDIHNAISEDCRQANFRRRAFTYDELRRRVKRIIEKTNSQRTAAKMEGINA